MQIPLTTTWLGSQHAGCRALRTFVIMSTLAHEAARATWPLKKIISLLAAVIALWTVPALAAGGSTVAKLSITTAQTLQAGAGNCAGASATCSATQFSNSARRTRERHGATTLRLWRHFRRRLVADKSRRRLDLDRRGRGSLRHGKRAQGYNLSALTPVTTVYTRPMAPWPLTPQRMACSEIGIG